MSLLRQLSGRLRCKRLTLNFGIFIYISLVLFALFNGNPRCKIELSPEITNRATQTGHCSLDITKLGIYKLDIFEHPEMTDIEKRNPTVVSGGKWKPKDCISSQKIAIIIPYRDRMDHLKLLLKHLHQFLQDQNRDYHIFVIEQAGDEKFNRGRLLNAGVMEALKVDEFDCFIFQDVDLLPEHGRNIYYCDNQARHLAAAIDEMRYHVMYYNYAGGVIALNKENIFKVNGYANDYWGWGSEDDDFSARTMAAGLHLTRPPTHIGRYKMVRHAKQWRADNGYDLFITWRSRWKKDGLNNIAEKYEQKEVQQHPLYTQVVVDLGMAPSKPANLEGEPRESLMWFLAYFFP